MADPLTYTQLLENSKEIDELLQSDDLNEEEKDFVNITLLNKAA